MPLRPFTARRRRIVWGIVLLLAFVGAFWWSQREASQMEDVDQLAALVRTGPTPRWDGFIRLVNKLPLVTLQTTETKRALALSELDRFGARREDLISTLVDIIQHPTPEIPRYVPARLLGRVGKPALPELIKLSEHPDPQVRDEVVGAFAQMGPVDDPQLQALARLLTDEHLAVSGQTILCLMGFGPKARSIEPQVRAALNDASPRRKVMKAILWLKIHPESDAAMNYLLDTWQFTAGTSFWSDFSEPLLEALEASGNAARGTLPILRDWLEHQDARVRLRTATLLWKFREKPQLLVPALDRLAGDEKTEIANPATDLLAAIGPDARGAVPNLERRARFQTGVAGAGAKAALDKIDPEWAAGSGKEAR